MSDTRAVMREFRFLEDKRKQGGLSAAEEQRWTELRHAIGLPEVEAAPAAAPVDPNAYAQSAAGYWASDGNWYPYPEGYDPNAYAQQQAYYDPNQQPQQPSWDPEQITAWAQQQGYDPVVYAQWLQQQGYPVADPSTWPSLQGQPQPAPEAGSPAPGDPQALEQAAYDPDPAGYAATAIPDEQGMPPDLAAMPELTAAPELAPETSDTPEMIPLPGASQDPDLGMPALDAASLAPSEEPVDPAYGMPAFDAASLPPPEEAAAVDPAYGMPALDAASLPPPEEAAAADPAYGMPALDAASLPPLEEAAAADPAYGMPALDAATLPPLEEAAAADPAYGMPALDAASLPPLEEAAAADPAYGMPALDAASFAPSEEPDIASADDVMEVDSSDIELVEGEGEGAPGQDAPAPVEAAPAEEAPLPFDAAPPGGGELGGDPGDAVLLATSNEFVAWDPGAATPGRSLELGESDQPDQFTTGVMAEMAQDVGAFTPPAPAEQERMELVSNAEFLEAQGSPGAAAEELPPAPPPGSLAVEVFPAEPEPPALEQAALVPLPAPEPVPPPPAEVAEPTMEPLEAEIEATPDMISPEEPPPPLAPEPVPDAASSSPEWSAPPVPDWGEPALPPPPAPPPWSEPPPEGPWDNTEPDPMAPPEWGGGDLPPVPALSEPPPAEPPVPSEWSSPEAVPLPPPVAEPGNVVVSDDVEVDVDLGFTGSEETAPATAAGGQAAEPLPDVEIDTDAEPLPDVEIDTDSEEEPEAEIELTEEVEDEVPAQAPAPSQSIPTPRVPLAAQLAAAMPPPPALQPAPPPPPPPPAARVVTDVATTLVLSQAELDAHQKRAFGSGTAVLSTSFIEGEHRVILHTMEGQVKRGTIRDVDLMDDAIPLEQQTGAAPERIPMARVKAIFFMAQAGAKPPPAEGQKIRVTFRDGRQVAGFSSDYKDSEIGFFIIPADTRTNTARIFVFRSSVQAIAAG